MENTYIEFIKADLGPRYAEFIGHEIQKAYLESYSDYGQNLFDRYVDYADAWIEDHDFKDPDTGEFTYFRPFGFNPREVYPGVFALATDTEASLREYLKL